MSPAARDYTAYGLRIRSRIVLPFAAASPAGEPDVHIRIGRAPAALAAPRFRRPTWEAAPGRFLMHVDGVARYFVREGREITVEPAGDDAGARNAFLLGSVLAACLKQRGILTLHASAVATDAGAVLFAGHSGAGKSTLLAALVERGYSMLADDVTGIVPDGGGAPVALPAFPCVRLWSDALETLGWQGRVREQVRGGMEKYQAPVGRFAGAPLPVRAIVVLTRHNREDIEIETVPPVTAFERLARRVYRKQYSRGFGQEREQFRAVAALAREVPVVRVSRSLGGAAAARVADRIEDCLRDGWPPRAPRPAPPGDTRAAPAGGIVAPAAEAPGGPVVWLASYPRSGNTWVRALLTNYLGGGETPASIDALAGGSRFLPREVFDEELGVSSSDLTPEEVLRHRALLHEVLTADLPRPTFVKVHDAFLRTAEGAFLFPPAATLGAVYVVRNPLDVAVSCARFWNWPLARGVAELNDPAATLARPAKRLHDVLPEPLSTWSGHVASWLDQRDLPVHVVRYEDLLADPAAAFAAVLRFAGIEPDDGRVARAVAHARFDGLRAQEEHSGFHEKPATARFFFRAGRAGAWREALSPEQVRTLVDAHAPLMERFGYLSEAKAFLRDDARQPPARG